MKNIVEKVIEKEFLMKNFLKNLSYIIMVMIMGGIFLTACGGRREIEADEIEASAVYNVEPDGTEREITDDEGEMETTWPYITWDDHHSGSYETWLHFSFSDGAEIDKELQYSPSVVEKVDFVDITGDGTDEVLVYRYFVNTATEYTLINFFQIGENDVTEISPGLELEELAEDVWNVIDEDFSEKEYDMPVFMMESYEKEHALAYTDKRVLVGYQGGGWQILEWFDCPKPDFENMQ